MEKPLLRALASIVFASWCGKKVNKDRIRSRAGWDRVSAIRADRIHEIKSTYILQPGPASLTEGVSQIHQVLTTISVHFLS
jgi:iron complex transport system substrate-binding protein